MTAQALTRLRLWLSVFLAVALALAVGVPSVLLARTDADRRRLERDDRVIRAAQSAQFLSGEDSENAGQIDTETYAATPPSRELPQTALLDAGGRFVAGDRELAAAVRREATRRRRGDLTAPVTVAAQRMVALSIEGENGSIGTAVALEAMKKVDDEIRSAELRIAGGALGAWVLLTGIALLLLRRALRPAIASAGREQAFLADAAHELRTPWAIVAARAQQGLQERRRREDDLRAIAATAAGAGAAITDMLELARLDAGRAMSEREPIRLDALVSTCAQEREAEAGSAGVEMSVDAAEQVVVAGDERLLRRAVGNLLDNALRHGRAGGQVRVVGPQRRRAGRGGGRRPRPRHRAWTERPRLRPLPPGVAGRPAARASACRSPGSRSRRTAARSNWRRPSRASPAPAFASPCHWCPARTL